MSSRVIGRADAATASALVWGRAANSRPEPALEHVPENGSGLSAEIAGLREEIGNLKRRIEAETSAGYQRGFHDGDAQAKAGVVVEMQAVIQRMGQAVADMAQLRPRLRREAETDVVQLSLAIARRVLRREVSIDPAAMQALVHVALQKLERQEICRVYVHPNQAAAVKAALDVDGARAEVIAEMTRAQGSLVFETNQGLLDASINTQLEEIDRGLTDRVNQS